MKELEQSIARLKKKALNLPQEPGVYLMKDKNDKIIYVGKAKALKNRVNSYFTAVQSHETKVYKMIMNVEDFDYILTDSEFEALVLECSLIKQYNPKYNILLKDDKGYHYIKVTDDEYRRIKCVKQKLNDNALYIGPYTGMFTLKESVDEALKIFKLPTCNLKLGNTKLRNRPCLNHYIDRCNAPCQGKISLREYNEAVDSAVEFLKGGSRKAISDLTEKMHRYSENLEFEKAAVVRDRISAIKDLQKKQNIISTTIKRQDIIAFVRGEKQSCVEVLRFLDFKLSDKEEFFLNEMENAPSIRGEFIKRYYYMRADIPPHICVDGEVEDRNTIEQWLSDRAKRQVRIFVPQRGKQLRLIQMCKKNAYEALAQRQGKISGKGTALLDELAGLLNLPKPPAYIEAYDISNLQGDQNVAGMVVFENAKPKKSAYKRFGIKTVSGQDDYASMQEVLTRRFREYRDPNNRDDGFSKLPDLILLDGGKGHVNAVKQVLEREDIDVPVFGMVKDSRHRTRAIARDGGEISIKSNRAVFNLITNIQDETHRFAISYHRSKRKKSALGSTLRTIDGIGEKKAKILLKHFKTMKNISEASEEEIGELKGISASNAKEIFMFFH